MSNPQKPSTANRGEKTLASLTAPGGSPTTPRYDEPLAIKLADYGEPGPAILTSPNPVDETIEEEGIEISRCFPEYEFEALYPRGIRPPLNLGPATPFDRYDQLHQAILHLAAGVPLADVMRISNFNINGAQFVKHMANFCAKSSDYTEADLARIRTGLLGQSCKHVEGDKFCMRCSLKEFFVLPANEKHDQDSSSSNTAPKVQIKPDEDTTIEDVQTLRQKLTELPKPSTDYHLIVIPKAVVEAVQILASLIFTLAILIFAFMVFRFTCSLICAPFAFAASMIKVSAGPTLTNQVMPTTTVTIAGVKWNPKARQYQYTRQIGDRTASMDLDTTQDGDRAWKLQAPEVVDDVLEYLGKVLEAKGDNEKERNKTE